MKALSRRIVRLAFDGPRPSPAAGSDVSRVDVVAYLVESLDAEEADVLRALAELKRLGYFKPERGPREHD